MQRTNVAKWYEKYHRWQIKVQKDNERRTFTSSTPGRKGQRECHAKADAWLDDGIANTNVKVEKLWNEYLEELKTTTSKSNWAPIENHGKNWILSAIGPIKIGLLTEQHLQKVINKAYSGGLSKKSISKIKAELIGFVKFCRKSNMTKLYPEHLTIPKGAPVKAKRILQPNELKILFRSNKTLWYGKESVDPFINAYRLQVLTGLRPGEVLGLKWSDVKDNTLYVRRSINCYNEITNCKNENAVRHFVLSESAQKVISEQRKLHPFGFIFGEIKPKSYYDRWIEYCKYNGIPHITPYELRHTFVSIAKNLSEGQVKMLVGHSKNMDTFGVYGHELKGELNRTASELNNLFQEILEAE